MSRTEIMGVLVSSPVLSADLGCALMSKSAARVEAAMALRPNRLRPRERVTSVLLPSSRSRSLCPASANTPSKSWAPSV